VTVTSPCEDWGTLWAVPRPPKNIYVRNCNLSEGVFAHILICWWKAYSAKMTAELIRKVVPEGEGRVSRESVSRLYGEIGDHLWLLGPCDTLIRAKVRDRKLSVEDAIAEIVREQDFYYEILKKERTPHEVTLARRALGVTWSPFSDRPIELLRLMFKSCNGFTRRHMNGYMTKALMIDRNMGTDTTLPAAMELSARSMLPLLKEYPLRAPLPRHKFPWIDQWYAMTSEDRR